jgi:hypothetical protein
LLQKFEKNLSKLEENLKDNEKISKNNTDFYYLINDKIHAIDILFYSEIKTIILMYT